MIFSQEKISIEYANINSENNEYAPVYYKNGIVFSSARANSSSNNLMTGLFFSAFKKKKFGKKNQFSSELKSKLHEGAITFTSDGNTAYFTRSQSETITKEGGIVEESKLGVFKTTFDGSKWGNITPCNFNVPEFSFGHPSVSSDGKALYITSDVKGGYGGKDLYYCKIKEGVCGPLVNLGEKVNSASNEFFPHLAPDNILYFSSDKKGGVGGLDLYSSVSINGSWSNATLLPAPINTAYDDFSITWHRSGTEGYFASNRKGSDDIFKININYFGFEPSVELKETQYCYHFFEEATLGADTVEMIYEWDFGDGNKTNVLSPEHCYQELGKYLIQLSILDELIGEKYKEEASFEIEIKEPLQPLVIFKENISVGEELEFNVKQGTWKEYTIANYYIDYGDGTVTKNAGSTHQYLEPGNKKVRVLIAGKDPSSGELKMNSFYKIVQVKSTK